MKYNSLPEEKNITIANKAIFKKLDENIGWVPNGYKALAFSRDGLNRYMGFQYGQDVLTSRQKTVINLIISEINQNEYSLAAYTQIGTMSDFTPAEIIEIRSGNASFDPILDLLCKVIREMAVNKGAVTAVTLDNYFAGGYTPEHLTDCILTIGEITIANYMYSVFKFPIDFKVDVPALD